MQMGEGGAHAGERLQKGEVEGEPTSWWLGRQQWLRPVLLHIRVSSGRAWGVSRDDGK